MTNYKIQRTQWAVGHGLFHSEEIFDENDELIKRTVFDCGSKGKGELIEREIDEFIKSTGDSKPVIHMLVVSHFDLDHVKGLDYLIKHTNIKSVKIPLLDFDSKLQLLVHHVVSSRNVNIPATQMSEIRNYLFESRKFFIGIEVLEMEYNDPQNELTIDNHHKWIQKLYLTTDISSLAEDFKNEFMKFVKSSNVVEFVCNTENHKAIKDKYRGVIKATDFKKTSLSMYSGPNPPNESNTDLISFSDISRRVGWLNTGDTPLKKNDNAMEFIFYYRSELRFVKYLTLAHHGSDSGFNALLMLPFTIQPISIASTGGQLKTVGEFVSNTLRIAGSPLFLVNNDPKPRFHRIDYVSL